MLATIRDDSQNVLNIQHIIPSSRSQDGIIQTSPVVAINRLKDPSTQLKAATTLEKPHSLHNNFNIPHPPPPLPNNE